jgi:1-acyl-sn-glycerol-3-phosphate acyltransferase
MARVYYPRIEVTGTDKIPESGAVLLCANHPNSLLDPVVLGLSAERPVKFFAKAPLFEKPVLGAIMSALGMIPAYRGQDDRSQVRRNLDSLDKGVEQLLDGHAVGIFPEGKSHDKLQVEKVRGGAARMALEAVDRGAEQLLVIAIGLNYECKMESRSAVWVQIAEPIQMSAWIAEKRAEVDNERKLLRMFTDELEARLQQVTIHLDEAQWQPWLDDLDVLAPETEQSQLAASETEPAETLVPQMRRRKQIADAINYFLEHDRQRALEVADEIEQYRDQVHAIGLRVRAPVLHHGFLASSLRLLLQATALAVVFLPALAGTLFHLVPFWSVRGLAHLFTPPGKTAVSFYRLLVGLPVYILWYVLAIFAVRYWMESWRIAALIAAMPLMGLIALWYWRVAIAVAADAWSTLRALLLPGKIKEIVQTRRRLSERIRELAAQYRARAVACEPVD